MCLNKGYSMGYYMLRTTSLNLNPLFSQTSEAHVSALKKRAILRPVSRRSRRSSFELHMGHDTPTHPLFLRNLKKRKS